MKGGSSVLLIMSCYQLGTYRLHESMKIHEAVHLYILFFMLYFKSPSLTSLPRLLNNKSFTSKELRTPFCNIPKSSENHWRKGNDSGDLHWFPCDPEQILSALSAPFTALKSCSGANVLLALSSDQRFHRHQRSMGHPAFSELPCQPWTASAHKTTLKWLQSSAEWLPTFLSRRDPVINFLPWAPRNERGCNCF